MRKDVPPYVRAGYIPASFSGINSVGLKRRGFSLESVNEILDVYRILYNSNLNVTQALAKIDEVLPDTAFRNEIVSFIKESKRGIIRNASKNKSDEDTGE